MVLVSPILTEVRYISLSSLGSVYLGKDIRIGREVAVKIGRTDNLSSTLSHEYHVYKTAAGSMGISPVHWYGKEGPYEVIVLEHLGTSLCDLISAQQFNHEKTFFFAPQIVRSFCTYRDLTELLTQLLAVESLHIRHYIHRDIKPGNIMIRADNLQVSAFLTDLGLAELFRNPATYLHNPYSTSQSIVGTLPFTSINGQQGHAQSRRDDLESLAYTIIYSACRKLPWSGLSSREAILRKKLSITVEELCKGLPAPFCKFINHIRSLAFNEKPDYRYLHSILLQCSQTETDQPDNAPL